MKALIVDDEKRARTTLKNLCNLCCPEITTLSEASNVEEAIAQIQQHQPDLIFLDINLGIGNGFDIIEALAHLSLNVIFVTAHSEYGIKALKASAIDYLLKPLQPLEHPTTQPQSANGCHPTSSNQNNREYSYYQHQ